MDNWWYAILAAVLIPLTAFGIMAAVFLLAEWLAKRTK